MTDVLMCGDNPIGQLSDYDAGTLMEASSIAPTETLISTHAYAKDDLLTYNGQLYIATSAIAVGDTITSKIERTTTTSYVNPTRMNHIEDGIESAFAIIEAHNTNVQGAVSLSNQVTVTVEAPKDCYLTIRSTNNDTLVGVYLYNTAVSLGQIRATSTAEWGAYTLFMRKGTKLDVQAIGTHGFYQITLLE